MRLASFTHDGRASWGIVEGQQIMDVGAELRSSYKSLRELIAADALTSLEPAAEAATRLELGSVAWLPVIPDPGKVLCVGLNYEMHRRETGRAVSEYPAIFTRFADSLLAHGANIVRPRNCRSLDYEGELAIIIGKGGRHIPHDRAMEHVAGYTCHNDATARDWQRHTTQFIPGKNFPATGALGPYLVTPDEITDLESVTLVTTLNGVVVQSATIAEMIFPIARLIEYVSSFTPLSAGDVIATGTPGGVGFKREPPLFMNPGDRVEVAISGVGVLVNGVAEEG